MKSINQWALVTGASQGLGYHYCQELLKKGYKVIGVSRNTKALLKLKEQYLDLEIKTYDLDLSNLENAYKLFQYCQELNVVLVINNAGYGVWGKFKDSSLDQELNMLNLNICSLHILTKLFVQRFIKNNYGRVINIASIAAFTPGPAFASYYASKAYVLSLGTAVNTELKVQKSKVRVISICPGSLKTNFWNSSGCIVSKKPYDSGFPVIPVDIYAYKSLNKALKAKNKNVIFFGFWNKILLLGIKLLPKKFMLKLVYKYYQSQH